MNGVIIEWDRKSGEGLVKADAGGRYEVVRTNWVSAKEPQINEKVTFELQDNEAIYVSSLVPNDDSDENLNKLGSNGFEASNFFEKLTEYGLHNYVSTVMMLFVLALSFSGYKSSSGGFSYDVSVSSGLTGFLFIIAAVAFSSLVILGVKPRAARWLGVFVCLVIFYHLISVYFLVLRSLEADSLEGSLYHFFEHVNVFNSFLLSVSFLLSILATILPKKINPNFASENELRSYSTKGTHEKAHVDRYEEKEQMRLYICYALLASAPFTLIGGVVAVVLSHVSKSDKKNELYVEHYKYVIKTFWFSFIWLFVSIITSFILIGIAIGVVLFVWFYYRVINGCLKLVNKQKLYK